VVISDAIWLAFYARALDRPAFSLAEVATVPLPSGEQIGARFNEAPPH
jgi:hypothetical protein